MALAACSHKYKTESYDPPPTPLAREGSAYIMLAENGNYGGRTYSRSGRQLSQATRSAFLRYLTQADLAPGKLDRIEAFKNAREGKYKYLVEPVILHWEDRATEWSGIPDKLSFKLTIWDPITEKVISTSIERASTRWFTLGGDHPQDLLPKMLDNSTNKLFP